MAISQFLKRCFNLNSLSSAEGKSRYLEFLPSANFEAANGITGISADYRLPRGMNVKQYHRYLRRGVFTQLIEWPLNTDWQIVPKSNIRTARIKKLGEEWKRLKQLNTELEKVVLEDCDPDILPSVQQDAIAGCASMFNPDDINFFIRHHIETRRCDTLGALAADEEYKTLLKGAEELASCRLQWVASPETLVAIRKQLLAKGKVARPTESFGF